MKESGENMWFKNLPAHTPPDGMWERIESRMDINLANEQFRAQLAGLPEHKPPYNLWARIEQNLVRRRVIRLGVIASGIAATLFLAFVLKGVLLPDLTETQPFSSLTKEPVENQTLAKNTGASSRIKTPAIADQERQKNALFNNKRKVKSGLTGVEQSTVSLIKADATKVSLIASDTLDLQNNSITILSLSMNPAKINDVEQATLSSTSSPVAGKNDSKTDTLTAWLLARNIKDNFPPPPIPAINSQGKTISIGFNFLPESLPQSDYGSTAYQTFAVMAQYQMPSVELRTGLGISYQSAPMGYKTDYAFLDNSFGSGKDTIINAGSVDISGKERSSFLYYSIGAGKRIYSNKRIRTSLQVGAGFSLLLANQNEFSSPVFDALKNQSNASLINTESHIPDINQTHFDLVTGFDFNYLLHKRWSLSIEPTLKYYFNPIYNSNESSPFSTGLRTGILFKL